jgi:threonine dehydratase
VSSDAIQGSPGSEVVLYDRFTEDREAIAARIAAERGMTLIPPYDHAHVMAGNGTAAYELLREVGELDFLFVCCGGGGMLAGSAIAAHRLSPNCVVIGVEPEAGNDAQQSLRSGSIVHIATPNTIADGAQTQHVGTLPFPVIQKHVRDIVTVSDAQLEETMRFFASRMKQVVEPTGCLGAAAVFNNKTFDLRGKRVGVVVSGGNVDMAVFCRLLSQ